ncbi:MAG: hypothetical protein LBH25_00665 [Fibromonadaceae bacterium]|jgi:predicted HTH domain antitoxin|nr:hypothetical protein [Fibromonadaceae bacterium]
METATIANETEIANAINALRLAGLDIDLIEEIELDSRLKISLEQADKGLGRPIEDFKKELEQKFASGYFSKENARKRIEERRWKTKN